MRAWANGKIAVGHYEGSREKAARKEILLTAFFPGPYGPGYPLPPLRGWSWAERMRRRLTLRRLRAGLTSSPYGVSRVLGG